MNRPTSAQLTLFVLIALSTVSEAQSQPSVVDADGFSFPEGAVHRFGSRKMRHPEQPHASAFSPNGKLLATRGDQMIVVWDLETFKAKRVLRVGNAVLWNADNGRGVISFTADSRALLTVAKGENEYENEVQMWSVETGQKLFGTKLEKVRRSFKLWLTEGGKQVAVARSCGHEIGKLVYFNITIMAATFTKAKKLAAFFS
jgi:WD40 repeat protein